MRWRSRASVAGAVGLAVAAGVAWRRFRRPVPAPEGTVAPPLAVVGAERIPVVGVVARLYNMVARPTELVERCRRQYGDVFTLRVPTKFDLTYLATREGFDFLMRGDADEMTFGAVMQKVPVIGFWFPRGDDSAERLQELLLAGRTSMASRLGRRSSWEMQPLVREIVGEHVARWGESVDLATAVPEIAIDAAVRGLSDPEFWADHRDRLVPLLRTTADVIDIPHTTLDVLPVGRFTSHHRACRELEALLVDAVAEHDRTGRYPFVDAVRQVEVDGAAIRDNEVPWMMMLTLWNAATYPGTYTFWTLHDVLTAPEIRREVEMGRRLPATELVDEVTVETLLDACFLETIRRYPVSSLPRIPAEDTTYAERGTTYFLRAGQYVAAFPRGSNRDPERFAHPDVHDPWRYHDGEGRHLHVFGRGAFGCVAQQFSRMLTTTIVDELLGSLGDAVSPPGAAEASRRCRVHQIYPGAGTAVWQVRPSHERPESDRVATGAEVFAGVPALAALAEEARSALVERLVRLDVPAGEDVCREGDVGHRYYLVGVGRLHVEVAGRSVGTLQQGDAFGEIALLSMPARRATVRSATDVVLYSLTRRDFDEVAAHDDARAELEATLARHLGGR